MGFLVLQLHDAIWVLHGIAGGEDNHFLPKQHPGNVKVLSSIFCSFFVFAVNYRGSLGFGQDSIDSLISHVGTKDVEDTQVSLFPFSLHSLQDVLG